MTIQDAKRIGIAAAYKGGEVLRACYGNLSRIHKKGRTDLVTEADTASERSIIATIRTTFPDHAILAEESGLSRGTSEHQWFIDPLDGTTNFAHGLDLFAVSIAYAHRGDIVLGVVLNPMADELFLAVRGQGAWLNNRPIRVSKESAVTESLLVTGFPYELDGDGDSILTRFTRCLKVAQGIRRLGSAALDLCYVACGRFGGYWEQQLHPWDTAAGMLIAREAGGTVSDFSNHPFRIDQKEILATNGIIHEEMLKLLSLEDTP